MKIFNTENNQNKVYVQIKDLIHLKEIGYEIPEYVISSLSLDNFLTKDKNEFLSTTDEKTIDFFKNLTNVPNYADFKRKKLNELNELKDIAKEELNTDKDNKQINHFLDFLNDMIAIQKNDHNIPFPEVPYVDGLTFNGFEDGTHMYSAGFDPHIVYLHRIDNQPLAEYEKISYEIISMKRAIGMIAMEFEEDGYLKVSHTLSEDKTKLIIRYQLITKDHTLYEDLEVQELNNSEDLTPKRKNIKELIKSIFKRK